MRSRERPAVEGDADLGVELLHAEVAVLPRQFEHDAGVGEEVGAEADVAALARPDEDALLREHLRVPLLPVRDVYDQTACHRALKPSQTPA